jgi:hypothetical protein
MQVDFEKDKTYGTRSYSVKRDVKQIQMELMTNGPVEAAFTVFEVRPHLLRHLLQHCSLYNVSIYQKMVHSCRLEDV